MCEPIKLSCLLIIFIVKGIIRKWVFHPKEFEFVVMLVLLYRNKKLLKVLGIISDLITIYPLIITLLKGALIMGFVLSIPVQVVVGSWCVLQVAI